MELTYDFRTPQQQLNAALERAISCYQHRDPETPEERAEHLRHAQMVLNPIIAGIGPAVKDILGEYIYTLSSRELLISGAYVYLEGPATWVYVWSSTSVFAPIVQLWLDEEGRLLVVYPEGGYPDIARLCSLLAKHTSVPMRDLTPQELAKEYGA